MRVQHRVRRTSDCDLLCGPTDSNAAIEVAAAEISSQRQGDSAGAWYLRSKLRPAGDADQRE